MTEADLKNIEAALSIQLPTFYRQWALRLPAATDEIDDYSFLDSFRAPAEIIQNNRDLHQTGEWAREHFYIGEFDGNPVFIDWTDPYTELYEASHDGEPYYDPHNVIPCVCGPAAAYLEDMLKSGAEEKPSKQKRSWWRFW